MGIKDAERLMRVFERDEKLRRDLLEPFHLQIQENVKPYMPNTKPRILVVGGGVLWGFEAGLWQVEYMGSEVAAYEVDKKAFFAGENLAAVLFDMAKEKGLGDLTTKIDAQSLPAESIGSDKKFDIVAWRNIPLHQLALNQMKDILKLIRHNGVGYFTCNSVVEFRELVNRMDTLQQDLEQEGYALEVLYPDAEEIKAAQGDLNKLPTNPYPTNYGFHDECALTVRLTRSTLRREPHA